MLNIKSESWRRSLSDLKFNPSARIVVYALQQTFGKHTEKHPRFNASFVAGYNDVLSSVKVFFRIPRNSSFFY